MILPEPLILQGFQWIGLCRSSVHIIYFTAGAAIISDFTDCGNGCKLKAGCSNDSRLFLLPFFWRAIREKCPKGMVLLKLKVYC
jgi:hypothetical protein